MSGAAPAARLFDDIIGRMEARAERLRALIAKLEDGEEEKRNGERLGANSG